jgi:hypothetical protein
LNATPRFNVVVVFATPPFWFANARPDRARHGGLWNHHGSGYQDRSRSGLDENRLDDPAGRGRLGYQIAHEHLRLGLDDSAVAARRRSWQ